MTGGDEWDEAGAVDGAEAEPDTPIDANLEEGDREDEPHEEAAADDTFGVNDDDEARPEESPEQDESPEPQTEAGPLAHDARLTDESAEGAGDTPDEEPEELEEADSGSPSAADQDDAGDEESEPSHEAGNVEPLAAETVQRGEPEEVGDRPGNHQPDRDGVEGREAPEKPEDFEGSLDQREHRDTEDLQPQEPEDPDDSNRPEESKDEKPDAPEAAGNIDGREERTGPEDTEEVEGPPASDQPAQRGEEISRIETPGEAAATPDGDAVHEEPAEPEGQLGRDGAERSDPEDVVSEGQANGAETPEEPDEDDAGATASRVAEGQDRPAESAPEADQEPPGSGSSTQPGSTDLTHSRTGPEESDGQPKSAASPEDQAHEQGRGEQAAVREELGEETAGQGDREPTDIPADETEDGSAAREHPEQAEPQAASERQVAAGDPQKHAALSVGQEPTDDQPPRDAAEQEDADARHRDANEQPRGAQELQPSQRPEAEDELEQGKPAPQVPESNPDRADQPDHPGELAGSESPKADADRKPSDGPGRDLLDAWNRGPSGPAREAAKGALGNLASLGTGDALPDMFAEPAATAAWEKGPRLVASEGTKVAADALFRSSGRDQQENSPSGWAEKVAGPVKDKVDSLLRGGAVERAATVAPMATNAAVTSGIVAVADLAGSSPGMFAAVALGGAAAGALSHFSEAVRKGERERRGGKAR